MIKNSQKLNRNSEQNVTYNFHAAGTIRKKYEFDDSLFSLSGDIIIANARLARTLTKKINDVRIKDGKTGNLVTAGQINALGLLHEIFHYLIRFYEEKVNPGVIDRGIKFLNEQLGADELNKVFLNYLNEFPPLEVYKGKISPEDYLIGVTGNKPNKEIIWEEILILHLENINPATIQLEEFYSDKKLASETKYNNSISDTEKFLVTEKTIGAENLPLFTFLKQPIIKSPHSIEGQLKFIEEKWGVFIYDKFMQRLLKGEDLIKEDLRLFLHGGFEKPTPPVPHFKFDEEYFEKLRQKIAKGEKLTEEENQFYYAEVEHFTQDTDWMPRVVMIAKNAFVWLHQLSKKYNRYISRLDQIPDEELNQLARWNFTALWLIGIWERSSASKKIKQYTGNPEAASSAYSLYDYVIAQELGGNEAFENLKTRAWQRGIRLASDMVPNHTGIYSKWVTEKPHYFIQTDSPPYPGYTFNGPNLSDDSRVEVRIEDKYYNRTDAAVVFQRKDVYTGDIKYIYHGNDGTHMPWNDTAQLNLLNPEVREALIQNIMHVARQTPIIRFDAAMTLAKKHYQRLWFPHPGTGGAIPSRSDYSMTRSEFDSAMPVEFWREVVDRINAELPDTLLLAEAFWLMEGYFVRTLGMHRVYNSAFMHMLMKEENDKYRELIKNTIEFNPEILKRYVNFMSNPDEETAVNQFGKGDKYFGVALLMITLPGLPMFAHGQIEGFSEKYGMEYKQAYYEEFIDDNLVARHETELFPLMRKRYLFSQVHNFQLYDFIDDFGNVNQNVFAYSNRAGNESTVIIYNNSYYETKGTINWSSGKIASGNNNLEYKRIGEAINIKPDYGFFYTFRDHRTGLEYIVPGRELHDHGIFTALNGYEYKVLMNFKEVYDYDGQYEKLNNFLHGKGVHSIEYALNELNLVPVHESLANLFSKATIKEFEDFGFDVSIHEEIPKGRGEELDVAFPELIAEKLNNAVDEVNKIKPIPLDKKESSEKIKQEISSVREFSKTFQLSKSKKRIPKWLDESEQLLTVYGNDEKHNREILFTVLILSEILNHGMEAHPVYDKLMMDKILSEVFEVLEHHQFHPFQQNLLIRILSSHPLIKFWKNDFVNEKKSALKTGIKKDAAVIFVNDLFTDKDIKQYLNYNVYEGIEYYNKERFDNLLTWIFTLSILHKEEEQIPKLKAAKTKTETNTKSGVKKASVENQNLEKLKSVKSFYEKILNASEQAEYRVKKLLDILSDEKIPKRGKKSVEKL